MIKRMVTEIALCLLLVAGLLGCESVSQTTGVNIVTEPYLLNTGLVSRSISFENPTGSPGEGGMTASRLGEGRKGSPSKQIPPGQEVPLCDIEGPGTIRHIWMTTRNNPANLRSLVLRAWWEGQEHPSIECPVGDFMGFAHGKVMPYHSAVHSLGKNAGMNIWLPMPFTQHAKITLTNEGTNEVPLFYQIDYTIADKHPDDVGRLHVLFARQNPTIIKRDFVMLPQRINKGRFIGAVLGIRNLTPGQWWGEGEIKVYMDGDTDFPTICGTGSEDYVGLSYGMQQTPYFYNGCSLNEKNFVSMYRWHLPDPIAWQKECRITIQQIAWKNGLMETEDDWSCATFWYEPAPSAPLPEMPDVEARTANIWTDES
ncbi:MAG: DUF2961 domain-containing protein [Sedimentisphaerales bacterium]|nr:DUF2961 domain-containing protein [Sedimentisphaerales bacterium]